MNSNFTRMTRIATLLMAVLVLATGPQSQAAGACGSTAFAHRGAYTSRIDENTLGAIERAHRVGAFTENDVFLTADGRFLIIHNRSLRPTTNCTGYVTSRRLADIRRHCHTTPNHMRIPTAMEAFRKVAHNRGQLMNLEIKGPGWYKNDNAKLKSLRKAAQKANVLRRIYFSNDTGYKVLTALKQSAPRARTAWKPAPGEPHITITHARRLSANAVMAKAPQWKSRAMVHRFKRSGIRAWATITNARTVWRQNLKHGVTAQLTGKPVKYRKWCRRVG
jgi:glycerophosphoryl diester phosphodiesterase